MGSTDSLSNLFSVVSLKSIDGRREEKEEEKRKGGGPFDMYEMTMETRKLKLTNLSSTRNEKQRIFLNEISKCGSRKPYEVSLRDVVRSATPWDVCVILVLLTMRYTHRDR